VQSPVINSQILHTTYKDDNRFIPEHLKRWKIQPAEEYDLVNIRYHFESGDIVNQKPDFITNVVLRNETSVEQSMEATFSEKAAISSSFTQNESFKLSVSNKISTPKIMGAGGEVTITTESTNSASFYESESKEDQRTYRFPVKVAPYTVVNAQAAVMQYQADVHYTATFKGRISGRNITMTGQWSGVTASTITYTLYEQSTKRILKTFVGTPTTEVDLTK